MRIISPISVGPVTIDMPVILAPMTGVTDMPFRTLVRRYGSGLNVTEMIATAAMRVEHQERMKQRTTMLAKMLPSTRWTLISCRAA